MLPLAAVTNLTLVTFLVGTSLHAKGGGWLWLVRERQRVGCFHKVLDGEKTGRFQHSPADFLTPQLLLKTANCIACVNKV